MSRRYSKGLHKAVQTTYVRYAEMILTYYKKKTSISLRAMSVLSLFAVLVMSMSVRRAHKYALGARPGTNATKVCLLLLHLV
jgi:hypothetical protein